MVFACGDTHIPIDVHHIINFDKDNKLTKDDYLIILGDFGLIWNAYPDNRENSWIEWFNDRSYTTLVLDGNHENHFRLSMFPKIKKFDGTVGKISKNIFHLKRGEIYIINDHKFFCFGGAESYDKEKRILGVSIWKEEIPNCQEMEYALTNLEKYNNEVDFILSHTAPISFLKKYANDIGLKNFEKGILSDPTTKFLDHIYNTIKFKKFFCAHFHDDVKDEKIEMLFEKIVKII